MLEVAISHYDFTDDEQKRVLALLETDGVAPRPCGSAGLEYLHIARGELDAVAFSWENAWDHAAGLLLVHETGGASGTVAGEPFTYSRRQRAAVRRGPGRGDGPAYPRTAGGRRLILKGEGRRRGEWRRCRRCSMPW
ncbi:hypothetical protein SRIMM317S_00547 [Streptomyces rimosus subsp. rimosus]